MPKVIIWSENAIKDVNTLIDYLVENWGKELANNYIDSITQSIKSIEEFPKIYPIIHKKLKVRKCVISKHNSIYYREKKDTIEILNIFDTRQNPKKRKFK